MIKDLFCRMVMAGTCLTFSVGVNAQENNTAAPTIIQVDPDKKCGKVNPLIFGNNFEAANGKDIFGKKDTHDPIDGQGMWNPDLGKPVPEIVAIAKDIRMGMLRYPGGCLTHNFDWHQAVGPKTERTYYKFGIDEYIELCRAIGAEPLMNVSELCSAKDAADLVEYLNMPASPEYPWAMKRADWGHKEPYQVKYFEMANESDHGNHDVKPAIKRNAEEYSAWYLACADAMRKKDKDILIGGHAGTGTPVSDQWNSIVLKSAGPQMDFFAVHTYVVGGQSDDTSAPMRACMASVDQVVAKLADYRALIKKQTGKDIPLAVTEFNAGFVQEKPVPYRFTFGAAMFCADYMREMMKPETNVAFANYWQAINGYWGFVRSKTKGDKTQITNFAAYPVFKLMGQHTGTELLGCEVSNEPKLEFEGFNRACIAKKDFRAEKVFIRNVDVKIADVDRDAYKLKVTGKDSMEIVLNNFNGESYFDFKSFPVKPLLNYTLTFDLKVTKEKGSLAPGLGLCDARGWEATQSASGVEGSDINREWTALQTSIIPLSSAKDLNLVLRLKNGEAFSGKVEIRNIKLAEFEPESFPPYSALTAFATGTSDPKVVKLIVINKHHAADLPAEIKMDGIKSAKLWTVSAPDFAVIKNTPDGAFERVSGAEIKNLAKEGFKLTVPARSINAIEIIRQ